VRCNVRPPGMSWTHFASNVYRLCMQLGQGGGSGAAQLIATHQASTKYLCAPQCVPFADSRTPQTHLIAPCALCRHTIFGAEASDSVPELLHRPRTRSSPLKPPAPTGTPLRSTPFSSLAASSLHGSLPGTCATQPSTRFPATSTRSAYQSPLYSTSSGRQPGAA
jgi:hypothetical protein